MSIFKKLKKMGGKKEKIEENTVGNNQIEEGMQKMVSQAEVSGAEEMKKLRQAICEQSFDATYKGLEIYVKVDDFTTLPKMIRVMELLQEYRTSDETYIDLKRDLVTITFRKSELDAAAHQLEKVRVTLTEEILNFTAIVQEMSNRYKLSPNWEGKKPVLIEKQKELEKRKLEYENDEQQLDKYIVDFYQQYTGFYSRLRENL